uniref:FHA domain-containing protein n=1 Tax=Aplanochytrium stocchinoi TaxID=215587 RepID=A0A7S3UYS7_9STRA|mmetsp:Transcript_8946/g.11235  ORF Transcript_8946/g.11235 Transcript_8946/m.11235 type:complete len:298 (-) Transcript_8946:370-1263(-)|eukprot:CAMPEP_0204828130 /NCGR_PEP_ID=MMETSP1346-20131115/5758_1 /ASSEMBLY_ACC=CAM_ASM_000771 /TAXON_ID=215587 /ORGANISM="Aplanochytrium stocchinoi, Strain GSBS06" /LENGTH=297 /DNA_ID=CAMNT_0051956969 /DNA_START=266 /DNA_END=1159 /DNA_ORIENTATION=-
MGADDAKRKREDESKREKKENVKSADEKTDVKKQKNETNVNAKENPNSAEKVKKPAAPGSVLPKEDGAFARLSGKCLKTGSAFTAYVTSIPATLGREHEAHPKEGFISLGNSKQISRIHAVIDYDKTLGTYTIEPKGKNSVTVRKVQYSPREMKGDDKKIRLNSRDPVRIGNIGFYFLRSTFEKPKEAYADLAKKIFEERPGQVLSTRDVCEHLVAGHLFFQANHSTPDAFTKLTNSLQQALRRSEYFERTANKARAEWRLKEDVTQHPASAETQNGKETKSNSENSSERDNQSSQE